MWEHHFYPMWKKIPDNRHAENIQMLTSLIEDMHLAGYAAAAIGRYIGRDHTTVLHHLKKVGADSARYFLSDSEKALREKEKIEKEQEYLTRLQQRTARYEEMKKVKQAIIEEKWRQKELRSQNYWVKRGGADKMREKVFKMYKGGATYNQMSLKYHVSPSRIQGLLIQHPLYNTVKRVRRTWSLPRPVEQYTKDGTLVREYVSGRSAGRQLGMASVAISMCAQGKIPSAGGYVWKYKKIS